MGRLTGETLDGETACYSYDHAGNRLTRTGAGRTEHYCYNSRNQLTGLDLTAQPAPSVMNMILPAAALRQRYIPRRAEALQSVPVTHMMRITGTHPYGQCIAGHENIPNRLRYNAQIEDDLTGLYYLRARYYNTGIGRFTQEDVIYNDGLNLYAYCSSNPVMYADPSGFVKKHVNLRLVENVAVRVVVTLDLQ